MGFGDFFADLIDFSTFGLTSFGSAPGPPSPPTGVRAKAQTEEMRRLAGIKARGGTLLTGGLGLSDDEDIIQKKTLLGG